MRSWIKSDCNIKNKKEDNEISWEEEQGRKGGGKDGVEG
jgi:hypothetical protein